MHTECFVCLKSEKQVSQQIYLGCQLYKIQACTYVAIYFTIQNLNHSLGNEDGVALYEEGLRIAPIRIALYEDV